MSGQTESIVPADYLHDDVQAVAEYRSISQLAVFAAVLGVCSPVALASKSLLVIPLLGTIVAVLALRRISASEGQLAGRPVALIGLALSLAIGAGVYARDVAVNRMVANEAEQWALEWCNLLLDDEVLTALELKNAPEARRPFDDSLVEYYETNDAAREALKEFREDPVVTKLTSAPDGSRVVAGKSLGVGPNGRGGFVAAQAFQLVLPDGSSFDFRLQLTRSRLGSAGGGAWYLNNHLMAE